MNHFASSLMGTRIVLLRDWDAFRSLLLIYSQHARISSHTTRLERVITWEFFYREKFSHILSIGKVLLRFFTRQDVALDAVKGARVERIVTQDELAKWSITANELIGLSEIKAWLRFLIHFGRANWRFALLWLEATRNGGKFTAFHCHSTLRWAASFLFVLQTPTKCQNPKLWQHFPRFIVLLLLLRGVFIIFRRCRNKITLRITFACLLYAVIWVFEKFYDSHTRRTSKSRFIGSSSCP
jgi:hypothetical protein